MLRRTVGVWLGATAVMLMIAACSYSDVGVTTAVKGKLAADATVKAYKIDVDTKDGVVTLNGIVETPAAKARAVELARNTSGVTSVVDEITLTPGAAPTTGTAPTTGGGLIEPITDAALTGKVKTIFLADPSISALKIDVDTKDGVVTLTGTVPTADEKTRAVDAARQTDGVKSVVDHLKVGRK